jgi:hypothetical protein
VAKGNWACKPGAGWFVLVIATSIQLYERLKISFSFSDALEHVHHSFFIRRLLGYICCVDTIQSSFMVTLFICCRLPGTGQSGSSFQSFPLH